MPSKQATRMVNENTLHSVLCLQDEIQKEYIEQEKEKEWTRFKVGTSLF